MNYEKWAVRRNFKIELEGDVILEKKIWSSIYLRSLWVHVGN